MSAATLVRVMGLRAVGFDRGLGLAVSAMLDAEGVWGARLVCGSEGCHALALISSERGFPAFQRLMRTKYGASCTVVRPVVLQPAPSLSPSPSLPRSLPRSLCPSLLW